MNPLPECVSVSYDAHGNPIASWKHGTSFDNRNRFEYHYVGIIGDNVLTVKTFIPGYYEKDWYLIRVHEDRLNYGPWRRGQCSSCNQTKRFYANDQLCVNCTPSPVNVFTSGDNHIYTCGDVYVMVVKGKTMLPIRKCLEKYWYPNLMCVHRCIVCSRHPSACKCEDLCKQIHYRYVRKYMLLCEMINKDVALEIMLAIYR